MFYVQAYFETILIQSDVYKLVLSESLWEIFVIA